MNLDKLIITLEKKGWKVSKEFLENNEEYLQDLVNEAEKQALILFNVSNNEVQVAICPKCKSKNTHSIMNDELIQNLIILHNNMKDVSWLKKLSEYL